VTVRVPLLALAASAAILAAVPARAQQEGPTSVKGVEAEDLEPPKPPAPSPSPTPAPARDDDREVDPVEPDFVVVNLPSQARLPRGGWAFRVTHRFSRPLGDGDLGDLASDFFGFDSGGLIGLEVRYGITRKLQAGVLRTSDRTTQLFAQRDLLRWGAFGAALHASVEGLDNFTEAHAPGIGIILSRRLGERGAVYAFPAAVFSLKDDELDEEGDTAAIVGLGLRFRFSEGGALLFEFTPRLNAPDDPDLPFRHPLSFGIEKTLGGHAFQLNVSNTFANTVGQLARGGVSGGGWYVGFNISRKFY
jgi:hypothetical protein